MKKLLLILPLLVGCQANGVSDPPVVESPPPVVDSTFPRDIENFITITIAMISPFDGKVTWDGRLYSSMGEARTTLRFERMTPHYHIEEMFQRELGYLLIKDIETRLRDSREGGPTWQTPTDPREAPREGS